MATLHIPPSPFELKRGDTFPEVQFQFTEESNVILTGATIKIDLYLGIRKVHSFISGENITISDERTFIINEIPFAENTLPVGILKGDIEITSAENIKTTYHDVVYTIKEDKTR